MRTISVVQGASVLQTFSVFIVVTLCNGFCFQSSSSDLPANTASTSSGDHLYFFLSKAPRKMPPKRPKKDTNLKCSTGTQTISTGEIMIKNIYTENF